MSRSYKKNKFFKGRKPNSKKINHKKFRKESKVKLKKLNNLELEEFDEEFPNKMEEVMNSYDIHEYRFNCISDEDCLCLKEYRFKKCARK